MLDMKWIRAEPEKVRQGLAAKNSQVDLDGLLELDRKLRNLLLEAETKKAERNRQSHEVARLKKEGQDASSLEAMKVLADEIHALDVQIKETEGVLEERLRWIPNLPHESVPIGPDSGSNLEVRRWGELPPASFQPRPHWEVGEELGLLDFRRAAKISGAGFAVFTGWGARLQRALIQFMLDTHRTRHGFLEMSAPYLVRRESMFGTGQLPKMEEDMYRCEVDDLFLIPTAEVSITNLYRDEVLKDEELPLYRMGYSPCFRREAGTYGRETRGLVRVHQFDKVELVKIVRPEESYDELESLVRAAEVILQALELPYRVLALASGDLSFAAAKCYDLEVWAPSEGGRWLEVSSCSNFETFQARRMNLRYRNREGRMTHPHTLNGSGLALPRVIVAILELRQTERGTVSVPPALRPYLDGQEELASPGP